MELSVWLIYLGVIAVLIIVPGPSALLCISHGLKYGPTKAMGSVGGGLASALCLMTLSAFGLGALLAASESAFYVLKFVGAAYLIVLGILMWRDARPQVFDQPVVEPGETITTFSLFKKGFMVGISNPKDLLFFAALFPSFMRADQPQFLQFFVLAVTWVVTEFIVMGLYANLGNKISRLLSNPKILVMFNRLTAGLFVLVGGALAVSNR